MCGNDLSIIDLPQHNPFLQEVRNQLPTRRLILRNTAASQKHTVSDSELALVAKFDLSQLEEIEFARCDIGHGVLEGFLKLQLTSLKILNLNNNRLGPIGCRFLADCPELASLTTLELAGNKVKDAGIKYLSMGNFPNLDDINLNDNGLTLDGLKHIRNIATLEYVSLCGNSLTDDSAQAIQAVNPSGLTYLALSRNAFTGAAMGRLLAIKNLSVLLIDRNKLKGPKSQLKAREGVFLFY